MQYYHEIYEHLCENPFASQYQLSTHVPLSRNTCAKYLHELYDAHMITGPFLLLKPCKDYPRYLYLMNFSYPVKVFEGLQGFPHVIDHWLTFGAWNTQILTDCLLDFSQLQGFEQMIFEGERGHVSVSHVHSLEWGKAFQRIDEIITSFSPGIETYHEEPVSIDWSPDEWKLFWAFRDNIREKKSPILKEIEVRHDVFSQWKKSLEKACDITMAFYPERKQNYIEHQFLVKSAYGKTLQNILDCMPVTCFLKGYGHSFMMHVYSNAPHISVKLFSLLYEMKAKRIIREVRYSSVLRSIE